MFCKAIIFVLASVLAFQIINAARTDTINQYKSILANQTNAVSGSAAEEERKNVLLKQEHANQTNAAVQTVDVRIATLKKTIADAKNATKNRPAALQCVTTQETAANALSSAPINVSCANEANYNALQEVKNNLLLLASVPNITLDVCNSLNPLPSQDTQFLYCVAGKKSDVDRQQGTLLRLGSDARNDIISHLSSCLTTALTPIEAKINTIGFEVTLCLSSNAILELLSAINDDQ